MTKIIIENTRIVENMLMTKQKLVNVAVAAAIKEAGFYIENEVVQSIAGHRAEPKSVDTGRLMGSIKTHFPKPTEAIVDTNVSYAKYLEYGTSRINPRHHFRNTAKRNTKKVNNFIKNKVDAII